MRKVLIKSISLESAIRSLRGNSIKYSKLKVIRKSTKTKVGVYEVTLK